MTRERFNDLQNTFGDAISRSCRIPASTLLRWLYLIDNATDNIPRNEEWYDVYSELLAVEGAICAKLNLIVGDADFSDIDIKDTKMR